MQGRSRILVIEDDPMFRSLVVSHLRKDYLVAVASEGKIGLEKAISHRPDLVIIDFQMPGWNGITTLKEFRRHANFSTTKFVMLTSDATKETVVSAIHAGIDDYIIKTTFSKELFVSKINKLLAPVVAKPLILNSPQQNATESKMATKSSIPMESASLSAASTHSTLTKSELPDTKQSASHPQAASEIEVELMMEDWE